MVYLKILIFTILLWLIMSLDCFSQSEKSDALFSKGMEAYDRGDYQEAVDWFSKAKELDDVELAGAQARRLYSTHWVAHCMFLLGDEVGAKEISSQNYSLKPVDRRLTVESDKEFEIAYEYEYRREYRLALEYALKGLALEEKALGQSVYLCNSCLFVGNLYLILKDADHSLYYYSQGLECLNNLDIEDSTLEFLLLQGRISSYLDKGFVAFAVNDLYRLEEIAKYEKEVKSNPYCEAVAKTVAVKIEMHKSNNRGQIIEKASDAFGCLVELYKPEEENLFFSLRECIDCFYYVDKREEAYVLMENALPILMAKNISTRHKGLWITRMGVLAPDRESAWRHLREGAELLWEVGDTESYYSNLSYQALWFQEDQPDKAIEMYLDILDFEEKINDSPFQRVPILRNLGVLYEECGQIERALDSFRKALSLLEEYKDEPLYVLTFMQFIAVLSKANSLGLIDDDYESGFALGQEVSDLLQKSMNSNFLTKGVGVHEIYHAIVPFFREMVRNAKQIDSVALRQVDSSLKSVVDYILDNFGVVHPYSCESLSLLAASKYNVGDYQAALLYMNDAIDIAKKMDYDYQNLLHDLAYFQYSSGDHMGAFENFVTGFEFLKNQTTSNYLWMTLDERSAFNDYYRGNIDDFPRLAAITKDDARYAELAYDALLFNKGLLLNSSIQLFRTIDNIDDKDTKKLLSELRNVNRQILRTVNSGKGASNDLREEAVRLEKQLMERSKAFGDYTKKLALTYKEVQSKLNPNDVAIELCSYRKNSEIKQYGALVLTKHEIPFYVDLGNDVEWGTADLSDEEYMNDDAFELFWGNLRPYLPSKENGVAYFAPDGIFHKIPIENLPGANDYRLHRLSSSRELVMNENYSSTVSSMAIFGGIDYGLGEVASFYSDVRNGKRASSEFLNDLPGALDEVKVIKETLDGRIKVDLKTGKDATKTNFMKASEKRPDLIHVATHGFFSVTDKEDGNVKDPLTCSGLYFSGAQNTIWNLDTDKLKDNGILTASEISILDMQGVRLAVLSACDSGKGSITPEGVFGLQRGFKQAGVNSLMISLWKVDDSVTTLLMTEFYRNLLTGLIPYDALMDAQGKVREAFPHSKDWAAFVLVDADQNIRFK